VELFAPGIVSRGGTELLALFSPDGRELYYTVAVPRFGGCILRRHMGEDGTWGSPEVVSFSGMHSDFGSSLSPDGNRFYFVSERPLSKGGEKNPLQDIWVADRTDTGWSEPRNLGAPVNSDARDLSPCVTADGTLYFNSNRSGSATTHTMDIFRAPLREGGYDVPEKMGALLDLDYDNFEPAVPADGSYMVLVATKGPDGLGGFDLYVAFRLEGDRWSKPRNLGPSINTRYNEHFPTLSPEGRYLFFVSDRIAELEATTRLSYARIQEITASPQNGNADIYWVSTELIESLRQF